MHQGCPPTHLLLLRGRRRCLVGLHLAQLVSPQFETVADSQGTSIDPCCVSFREVQSCREGWGTWKVDSCREGSGVSTVRPNHQVLLRYGDVDMYTKGTSCRGPEVVCLFSWSSTASHFPSSFHQNNCLQSSKVFLDTQAPQGLYGRYYIQFL